MGPLLSEQKWRILGALTLASALLVILNIVADKCGQPEYANSEYCGTYDVAGAWLGSLAERLSRASVALTAVATGFIAWFTWTLRQSTERLWEASKEQAEITRRIGQTQASAYLSIENGEFTINRGSFHGWITVKNYGQSPARQILMSLCLKTRPAWFGTALMTSVDPDDRTPTWERQRNFIQAGATTRLPFHWTNEQLGAQIVSRLDSEKFDLVLTCELAWMDVFGSRHTISAEVSNQPHVARSSKKATLHTGTLHVR